MAAQTTQVERRRAVRCEVEADATVGIRSSQSVRVIDISVGGVLLASTRPAAVGTRGRLTISIAGNPLAAEVEIRRVVDSPDHTNFRIGARFVDITHEQRHVIERLVRS